MFGHMVRVALTAVLLWGALSVHAAGIVAAWSVDSIPTDKAPNVRLVDKNKAVVTVVRTDIVAGLRDVLQKIEGQAGIKAEFYIVKYDDNRANAFAGAYESRNIVGITPEMIEMMNDDLDIYAAIFGHEIAHLTRKHGESRAGRRGVLDALGTVFGLIIGSRIPVNPGRFATQLVDRAFSRDEEREADRIGFDYLVAAGFDPMGAVRAQEKLLAAAKGGASLPFMSTHPGAEERIETFRKLAAALPARERTPLPARPTPSPAPVPVPTEAATPASQPQAEPAPAQGGASD